jgi:hypothetical protein
MQAIRKDGLETPAAMPGFLLAWCVRSGARLATATQKQKPVKAQSQASAGLAFLLAARRPRMALTAARRRHFWRPGSAASSAIRQPELPGATGGSRE